MKKKVTIILLTYNSDNHIFECLQSIDCNNDIGDELEIIVVDNMSTHVDSMFIKISQLYGNKVTLIKNHQNGGYGQGNNVGVKNANSTVIMIMNPDVRLIKPIFKQALLYFENNDSVMLGMTQMINKDQRGISFAVKVDANALLSLFETVIFNKLQIYNPKRMYFSGACFFIDKNTFENLGLFDENVFMYGEENDLHHRLLCAGLCNKISFDKSLTYLHLVEHRPPALKSALLTIDSIIAFCLKYNLDVDKKIRGEMRKIIFFTVLEFIRNNKSRVAYYKEFYKVLYQKKKKLTLICHENKNRSSDYQ